MEQEWRCKECETLHGVERGGRLHLRYKQAQYIVEGGSFTVLVVCRNCSAVNEWNRGGDPPLATAANA